MRSARFGFRETLKEEEPAEEPRASRMPPHMPSIDPAFLDAIREVPEDAAREKEGRG